MNVLLTFAPRRAAGPASAAAAWLDLVSDRLRAAVAGWRRRRRMRATARALRALDARTLHDLGLVRAEADSVAAEVHSLAPRTRLRVPAPEAAAR